jgi:hypothetical protein
LTRARLIFIDETGTATDMAWLLKALLRKAAERTPRGHPRNASASPQPLHPAGMRQLPEKRRLRKRERNLL